MFYDAASFVSDLSDWDMSLARSTLSMFSEARLFNSDLSRWQMGNVEELRYMFAGAETFDSDLPWDVSKATSLEAVFQRASAFNG